jgi:hypothetical protein
MAVDTSQCGPYIISKTKPLTMRGENFGSEGFQTRGSENKDKQEEARTKRKKAIKSNSNVIFTH